MTQTFDFAAESRKARAKLSRKSCAAWHKYNAGAMGYDEVQNIIKAAEAVCDGEIEAAYKATDPQASTLRGGHSAGVNEVVTVSP